MSIDGGQRPPDPPPPPPPQKVAADSRTWDASADLRSQESVGYFDAEAQRYGEIGDYGVASAMLDAGDRARSLIGDSDAGNAATAGAEAMERWETSEAASCETTPTTSTLRRSATVSSETTTPPAPCKTPATGRVPSSAAARSRTAATPRRVLRMTTSTLPAPATRTPPAGRIRPPTLPVTRKSGPSQLWLGLMRCPVGMPARTSRTAGTRTSGTRTSGTRTAGTRTSGSRTAGTSVTRTAGTRTSGTRTAGTRTSASRTAGTASCRTTRTVKREQERSSSARPTDHFCRPQGRPNRLIGARLPPYARTRRAANSRQGGHR